MPHDVEEKRLWAAIEAAGSLPGAATFDPDRVDDVLAAERATAQYDRRKSFVASYAWAVPTRAAVERIRGAVGGRKLLEVCAGNGLWARLLAAAGVPVIATDGVVPPVVAHHPVQRLEAETAVRYYRDCGALLLCWPPFKDDCAYRALQAFEGDRVISIGDARFTAEDRFHSALTAAWELIDCMALPSWPGTADEVRIYGRG